MATQNLSADTLNQLSQFAGNRDRVGYWSTLANLGDPYAKLVLGVALNNTLAGQVANEFMADKASQAGAFDLSNDNALSIISEAGLLEKARIYCKSAIVASSIFVTMTCCGCAPWVRNDESDINESILLKSIDFRSRVNGQFSEFSDAPNKGSSALEKVGAIEDTDIFLESMGSNDTLSLQAENFLQRDRFTCNNEGCSRRFSVHSSFGNAFLAIPALFYPNKFSTRQWDFKIYKRRINGHFLDIQFYEE